MGGWEDGRMGGRASECERKGEGTSVEVEVEIDTHRSMRPSIRTERLKGSQKKVAQVAGLPGG